MMGRSLDGDPFQAQRLDGRVLVVTGGTHGLGAARAARLGAAGIVTCGRDATRGVIDFDQTVHGSSGEHVAPAPTGAPA